MTIDEAVEIRRKYDDGADVRPSQLAAAEATIVTEYLWLTDPTPLTVELIERELGFPERSSEIVTTWRVTRTIAVSLDDDRLFVNEQIVSQEPTLGDLRQIVRMLGGGK